MTFEDKTLNCKDCGKEFVWTAGEQKFYADKGFENSPTRCQDCRKQRKKEKRAGDQYYPIICKNCGKAGQVPFQPRDPNSLLCAECFAASKQGALPEKPAEAPKEAPKKEAPEKEEETESDTETPAEETPADEK